MRPAVDDKGLTPSPTRLILSYSMQDYIPTVFEN